MFRNKFEAFNYRCAVSLDEKSAPGESALLCLCPPRSIKGYLHTSGLSSGGWGGRGVREVFMPRCFMLGKPGRPRRAFTLVTHFNDAISNIHVHDY